MSKGDFRLEQYKPKIPIHKITPVQMDERRKKGLCYNCDEHWKPGHKCTPPKLFLMECFQPCPEHLQGCHLEEIIEFDAADNSVSDIDSRIASQTPEFTLYALIGQSSPETMKVFARINNHWVFILIDTGSTHNFLDSSLLEALKLPMSSRTGFAIKVANGDVIMTQGTCADVPIKMRGNSFVLGLHLISLGGCDTVLGTQWLSSLDLIQWDFKSLTMQFMYMGERFFYKG